MACQVRGYGRIYDVRLKKYSDPIYVCTDHTIGEVNKEYSDGRRHHPIASLKQLKGEDFQFISVGHSSLVMRRPTPYLAISQQRKAVCID